MDLYRFVSWCLTIIAVVTVIWPVNTAFVALAYKVSRGGKPIDMEAGEFWWRCCFAALGLAGLTLVILGVNYWLVEQASAPSGPVQMTLFFAYLAAATGYLFWMLALEDMLQGTGVFLLYILLPGLPLLLVGRMVHAGDNLMQWAPWLLAPA